jgi:hypothetical protein
MSITLNDKPLSPMARAIIGLAEQHGVKYVPTPGDAWAQDVTRLADDEVTLDGIELLLIALQRAGHLSRPEALRLQVNYLREARAVIS